MILPLIPPGRGEGLEEREVDNWLCNQCRKQFWFGFHDHETQDQGLANMMRRPLN